MINTKIIKRDGRAAKYDISKIKDAIEKAWIEVHDTCEPQLLSHVSKMVEQCLSQRDEIEVEEIQELVKSALLLVDVKVAKAYIEYATSRAVKREMEMDLSVRIDRLVNGDKELVNENANKDSRTFSTKRDLIAGQVAKAEGLKMLPLHVREAHLRGDIHFHDVDYSPYLPLTNCCLIDLKFMFENGFNMGNAVIGSPKSIQTAVAQTSQIVANVASSQYGGVSMNRLDEILAPYAQMNFDKHLNNAYKYSVSEGLKQIYAVEQTKKDIYDAMQSLEYEINTLYTSQGQTPFSTIGFGLGTSWIEKEIQKSILTVRLNGLGEDKKTAIFPKLLFGIKDGINLKPGDSNYDIKQLALKCASERMYPDILNYDTLIRLTGSFKASMGCRSFLQGWVDPETGEQVDDGRMNLGVVTLNLPRIAIQSKGDKNKFWELFEDKMSIVHDALIIRKESVMKAAPENAPILYKHGAFGKKLKDGESVLKLFKNKRATISIGYIGLYEVGSLLFDENWENNPEAREFTLEILKRMKRLGIQWSEEEGIWYSVYGTPSESLTDRFCKLDKDKFGSIKGITDKDYYTNSFHYDVRKNPTPFDKIDFEKDYPIYASGGFIHYVEYPNLRHNIKALEQVWDYSYDKVGYLGTNAPIDKCFECSYEGEFKPTEIGFECPTCRNNNPDTCDVIKRTCGYLGNPLSRPMAKGRHKEISSRLKHI